VRIVVQKYGGSSVADLVKIRGVAERVARTREQGLSVVVVVSAMGSTTNELLALAHKIAAAPARRELDMLLSTGERTSMALLALALNDMGVSACSLTGSQSGIITDEAHADARVVEVRPDRVRQRLEAGDVVIVGGFQGVSRTREVTTLGRGGSDQTAVVLAAALGALHCEICSDVDGVWSADPRVVPEAVKLEAVSLDQALALARGGAKVLYEEAVRYARDNGVTIVAASTFGPGSGTRLATGAANPPQIAISGDDQLVRVRLGPSDRSATARAVKEAGGRVRRVLDDVLHVDIRNAHSGLLDLPGNSTVEAPIAVVTAVGSALGEHLERVEHAELRLGGAGIVVLARGTAGDQAWWEVDRAALIEATRVLHTAFNG
jgi:aspartate kinase